MIMLMNNGLLAFSLALLSLYYWGLTCGSRNTNRHIASQPFTQPSDMSLVPGFVEPSKYFEDTSWWISLKILNKSKMGPARCK